MALSSAEHINYMFMNPVDAAEVPDYYDVVQEPMYINLILQKNKEGAYHNRKEFLQDVRLIAVNAHSYNDTRHTWIPPLADQLVTLCEKEMGKRARQLASAEGVLGTSGVKKGRR